MALQAVSALLPLVVQSSDSKIASKHNNIQKILQEQHDKGKEIKGSQFIKGRLKPVVDNVSNISVLLTALVAIWVLLGSDLKQSDKVKLVAIIVSAIAAMLSNTVIPGMKSARKEDLQSYSARINEGNIIEGKLTALNTCLETAKAILDKLHVKDGDYQTSSVVASCALLIGSLEGAIKKDGIKYFSAELMLAIGSISKSFILIRSDGILTEEEANTLRVAITDELIPVIENEINFVDAQYTKWKQICAKDPATTLWQVMSIPKPDKFPLIGNQRIMYHQTKSGDDTNQLVGEEGHMDDGQLPAKDLSEIEV